MIAIGLGMLLFGVAGMWWYLACVDAKTLPESKPFERTMGAIVLLGLLVGTMGLLRWLWLVAP